ncbi:MAG TPA: chromosome segregation protein SMC, partial [Candidatus Angelobacter sp.]|nr:chromosome segregation protein SMC [Candidatus Angelobacter sp.]
MQKQGNTVRLDKLSTEKIQLEEERTRLETRLQEFSAGVEAEKQHIQQSRGSLEERQERLQHVQQELAQSSRTLEELLRQQAEKRSRLNLLDQLQSDYEGFSSGTLAALKGTSQVLGSLTDRIRVPDQYITAVEAALGHHLQLVLTENPENAHAILADLNANKKGRASIAALSFCQQNGRPHPAEGLAPANATAALSVVESDEATRPLLARLLDQTYILPDLSSATSAWRQTDGHYDFVTLSGELLSRHGVFTGGSGNGASKNSVSALARKNQIAELRAAVAEVQERVEEASRQKGAWQSEQSTLTAGLQQAQTELRTQEVAMASREGEFRALESSLRVLHQKIDTVVYEIQTLAGQEQEAQHKREQLAQQVQELERRDQALQQQVSESNAALETLRHDRDGANAALTEVKVTLAAEEQLCASFRQQQQSLEHRLHELGQLIEHRRAEMTSFVERRAKHQAESEDSRQRIESLQHERA